LNLATVVEGGMVGERLIIEGLIVLLAEEKL